MLLGCTEFTKVYLQIKDDPWPYVNLVNLAQNSGMRDGEVVELLKIANGYLPRVRLEYDRLKEEKRFSEAELNSWKAEINSLEAEKRNSARMYQDLCDRNLALTKREDELRLIIDELEGKVAELQQRFNKSLSELQDLTEEELPKVGPSSRTIIFDTRDLLYKG